MLSGGLHSNVVTDLGLQAPIWGADGAFGMVYTTLDVTADVTASLNSSTGGGKFLVAAQSVVRRAS